MNEMHNLLQRVRQAADGPELAAGLDVLAALRFLQHGLRRGEARERDAVRGAAHVVEADLVAELDRARLAAVLAADAELDVRLRLAAALDADAHEVADAFLVEHLERVPLEHAVLEVEGEELALGVVARHAERRLREVVRAEGEEVRDLGDLVGAQRGARQLDHRPAEVLEAGRLLLHHRFGELAKPRELLAEADERVHDLDERRLSPALLHRLRRARDRAHLHLVHLRPLDPEPAAARAEHRVRLGQRLDALAHPLVLRLLERRQELVERRVEQADRDRQPRHRLEDRLEVGLLEREEPVERVAAALLVAREDHLLHDGQPLVAEEHVLGAAEADALRAELARLRGVLGVVGVRAHLEAPRLVGPLEKRLEVLVDVGRRRAAPRRR